MGRVKGKQLTFSNDDRKNSDKSGNHISWKLPNQSQTIDIVKSTPSCRDISEFTGYNRNFSLWKALLFKLNGWSIWIERSRIDSISETARQLGKKITANQPLNREFYANSNAKQNNISITIFQSFLKLPQNHRYIRK